MLRSEVENLTGLSRKAIEYYEEVGLINPSRDENGYRSYKTYDIEVLEKISMYRSLGLSIREIKEIFKENSLISSVLRKRQFNLDQENKKNQLLKRLLAGEDPGEIKKDLEVLERSDNLYEKLEKIFPGYFGQAIFAAYRPFFQEGLSEDGQEAFEKYVEYLDSLPRIDLTEDEKTYIEGLTSDFDLGVLDKINQEKISAVEDTKSWLEENKEALKIYEDFMNSSDYQNSKVKTIKDKLNKYMVENNYYEIAIPLIRTFSPAYNDYYEKLLKANEFFEKIRK